MKPVFGVRAAEIYLDNAATTMIDPEVLYAMRPYLEENYGDPESCHHLGQQAKESLTLARELVAELLGCPSSRVFFTSGGTEANNWAIKGVGHSKVAVSAIEHPSVTQAAGSFAKEVPVNAQGLLDLAELDKTLADKEVRLVSVQYANHEIGTVQPIKDIAALVHARGALFHVDAVQAFGKIPVLPEDDGIDLLSVSAHKLHGPVGVGALYVNVTFPLTTSR